MPMAKCAPGHEVHFAIGGFSIFQGFIGENDQKKNFRKIFMPKKRKFSEDPIYRRNFFFPRCIPPKNEKILIKNRDSAFLTCGTGAFRPGFGVYRRDIGGVRGKGKRAACVSRLWSWI